jgi:DNA recombination protein RmuC
METLILAALIVVSTLLLVTLFHISRQKPASRSDVDESIRNLRWEWQNNASQQRQELLNLLNRQDERIQRINSELNDLLRQGLENQQNFVLELQENVQKALATTRQEQTNNFDKFNQEQDAKYKSVVDRIAEINLQVQENLQKVQDNLKLVREEVDKNLKSLRDEVDKNLKEIRENNEKKLEEMRKTVDEKLNETLNTRLNESFRLVSERLEQVHKGLGEMQTLAAGVGDLKKVLTNVKTRGILGEVQLGNIFENILSRDQYEEQVRVNPFSNETVDFAVKLPGRDEDGSCVWLPVDSKFPLEAYLKLEEARYNGDVEGIQRARREFENVLLQNAESIRSKYLAPPHTTDFAIMFLPTESLYAEALQNAEVVEKIQREKRVILAGPTTFTAVLNSLQMGFRTLAIEKRSHEVWKVLGAVKTEFQKFQGMLEKAKKKVEEAGSTLDELITTRTRQMNRKLREVESLPESEANRLLRAPQDEEPEEADVLPEEGM